MPCRFWSVVYSYTFFTPQLKIFDIFGEALRFRYRVYAEILRRVHVAPVLVPGMLLHEAPHFSTHLIGERKPESRVYPLDRTDRVAHDLIQREVVKLGRSARVMLPLRHRARKQLLVPGEHLPGHRARIDPVAAYAAEHAGEARKR